MGSDDSYHKCDDRIEVSMKILVRSNIGEIERELGDIPKKIAGGALKVYSESVRDQLREDSPKDTGEFAASWVSEQDKDSAVVFNTTNKDIWLQGTGMWGRGRCIVLAREYNWKAARRLGAPFSRGINPHRIATSISEPILMVRNLEASRAKDWSSPLWKIDDYKTTYYDFIDRTNESIRKGMETGDKKWQT